MSVLTVPIDLVHSTVLKSDVLFVRGSQLAVALIAIALVAIALKVTGGRSETVFILDVGNEEGELLVLKLEDAVVMLIFDGGPAAAASKTILDDVAVSDDADDARR